MTPERLQYTATITLSGPQLRLQLYALDLFLSLGLGRIDDIAEALQMLHPHNKNLGRSKFDDTRLVQLCNEIKLLLGLTPHSNFGIGNEKNHRDTRNAFDLLKAYQKLASVAENMLNPGVWGDGVIVKYGDQPVPTASYKRDTEEVPVKIDHEW